MKPFCSQLDKRLLSQSHKLAHLTSLLHRELPPECDGHYHVASIQGRTLCIVTDSPVWTTRLRQLAPQILQILSASGHSALLHTRVISRLGPAIARPAPAIVKRQLSQSSSQFIRKTASYIKDADLSRALARLSRHSAKN